MLTSVLENVTSSLSVETSLLCTLVSVVLGLVLAVIFMTQGTYTKSYIITLALLPALVQTVIMLVNGNLGTGIAVMGAFGLVRFRSMPGTSREISGIFFAMVVGLAAGMGYLTYAALITFIIGTVVILLNKSSFGEVKIHMKDLKITIPENLDYTDIFDDIFDSYTNKHILNRVKTTNMGSMYELQYHIQLKDERSEKEFIDKIRCRNGNLTIVCGRPVSGQTEL
ncbi:MAG: DUF4956 domain-containing protein [Lachnospiraceae bacterium]|nr:DUF4956 domain-containing protein [Lachnospiraceae bacterium]